MTDKKAAAIIIPDMDPINYDLDWRYRTAMQLAGRKPAGKKAPAENTDAVVAGWVRYLANDTKLAPAIKKSYQTVLLWAQSAMGEVLKPRLLTDESYEAIAETLGLDADTVALFEKSSFNVRNDAGDLRPLPLLHKRFIGSDPSPNPEIVAALQAGAFGLDAVLGIPSSAGTLNRSRDAEMLRSMAGQQLAVRMLRGDLKTRDLIVVAQIVAEASDEKSAQDGYYEAEYMRVMTTLLDMKKPKRVPVEAYAPHLDETMEAEANNRAAQGKLDAYGTKGGAMPVKGGAAFEPTDLIKNSERHKRDAQDLVVSGGGLQSVKAS